MNVGVRQDCVRSPWLFKVFVEGALREMRELG